MGKIAFLRTRVVLTAAVTVIASVGGSLPPGAATAAGGSGPICAQGRILCTEVMDSELVFGEDHYVGHDEPSALFYSNTPGSGNNNHYLLTLPTDPPIEPTQDGTGGTFNFQLHPAFWFGMAMCDSESAPEYTKTCTPNSDANIFDNPSATAPDYIGHHPGGAYMEMQFYPPGWVNQPAGTSCSTARWCAALNIDSLSSDQQNGTTQNAACLSAVGIEPVNFAYITRSGNSLTPANPLNGFNNQAALETSRQLMFQPGDRLSVDLHDTAAGFQVAIADLTSGQSGSMTASIANGFAQVLYEPAATTCHARPAAFHPMYSTSSEHTRLTWTAHSYNVAFSDEIGHFEYCRAVDSQGGNCTAPGVSDSVVDADDNGCFAPKFTGLGPVRIKIGGCLGTDVDFDGPEYLNTWPGTFADPAQDAAVHAAPVLFTSPTANGLNFDRVAFETDLPRIEFATTPSCNRRTGAGCVNPPVGATFYPFFTTGTSGGQCVWQLGGKFIPGTTNNFGGSSTAAFGPLLLLTYPTPGGSVSRYNDFRKVAANPCNA